MQISIVVVVDTKTTLSEDSLKNNVYFIDNTSYFSRDAGMPDCDDFLTHVCGVCNCDGSQAEEAVLNWVGFGLPSTLPTLPRNYAHIQASAGLSQTVTRLGTAGRVKIAHPSDPTPTPLGFSALDPSGTPILSPVGTPFVIAADDDSALTEKKVAEKGIRKTNKKFHFAAIVPHRSDSQKYLVPDDNISGYISPRLSRIHGPAVDAGVIFPAMYGSPMAETEGWYWSASVDVSKEGIHAYCMDITLFQAQIDASGDIEWFPRTFTFDCKIAVSRSIKTNGFATPSGFGVLPLPFPSR